MWCSWPVGHAVWTASYTPSSIPRISRGFPLARIVVWIACMTTLEHQRFRPAQTAHLVFRLLVRCALVLFVLVLVRSGPWGIVDLYEEAQRWTLGASARLDLRRVGAALEAVYAQTGRFPDDFGGFLERRQIGGGRRDAWGTDLVLRTQGPHYEIVSAGPDGTHMTPDDIVIDGRASADR